MTEKIKDFLYDFSDIFLGLLIVGCMVFVISWQITGIMDIDIIKPSTYSTEGGNSDYVENPEDIIYVEPVAPPDETPVQEENQIQAPPEESQEIEPINITVEIPKGTTGLGIAKILKEKNLISNTTDFITKVEEMNLGPKLRFGTFKIKSNSTIEEMIHIITGIN